MFPFVKRCKGRSLPIGGGQPFLTVFCQISRSRTLPMVSKPLGRKVLWSGRGRFIKTVSVGKEVQYDRRIPACRRVGTKLPRRTHDLGQGAGIPQASVALSPAVGQEDWNEGPALLAAGPAGCQNQPRITIIFHSDSINSFPRFPLAPWGDRSQAVALSRRVQSCL